MIIYKLWDVIMCVVLASFACNDTWEEIHDFVVDNYSWIRTFFTNDWWYSKRRFI